MNILHPIKTSINIPIDDDLLHVLITKINNLKQENEHLKNTIRSIQNEQSCIFSVNKEPEIINHTFLTGILRLACFCSIETHNHQQHVRCKILSNDEHETKTFAYYLSEESYKHAPLSIMLEILANLHKELLHSMIEDYQQEMTAK